MKETADAVAANVRAELGRQNMSRAELARRLDVAEMWLSRRLTGRTPITVEDLGRIATALGVPAGSLLPVDAA